MAPPKNPELKKDIRHSKKQNKEDDVSSQASSNMEDERDAKAKGYDSKFDQILEELRDFRKDNREQMDAMREDINGFGGRMDEAEERIEAVETRIQTAEEILTELTKLHTQTQSKLMALEGQSRRDNVRIYGVEEGAEENSPSVITFVQTLLEKGLGLASPLAHCIERAHRSLAAKPPAGAPPRSLVVKFSSYRTKEDILKKAWQAKGFDFQGKRIYLDNDYAPEVLRRRKEYTAAKAALREKNIRFQTPFPFKLRVFYGDGTVTYNSAQEATEDMVQRGISVAVVKKPVSVLDEIQQLTWQRSGKKRRSIAPQTQSYKERLQVFRHENNTE